jgi:hypothetical protein
LERERVCALERKKPGLDLRIRMSAVSAALVIILPSLPRMVFVLEILPCSLPRKRRPFSIPSFASMNIALGNAEDEISNLR